MQLIAANCIEYSVPKATPKTRQRSLCDVMPLDKGWGIYGDTRWETPKSCFDEAHSYLADLPGALVGCQELACSWHPRSWAAPGSSGQLWPALSSSWQLWEAPGLLAALLITTNFDEFVTNSYEFATNLLRIGTNLQ